MLKEKIADIVDRCMDVMKALLVKHSEGYEGWARQKGEQVIAK